MREVEFVPEWYPRLLSKRRATQIQAWLTLAVAALLAVWLAVAGRSRAEAEESIASVRQRLELTRGQLAEMDRLMAVEKELSRQEETLRRLGTHVESTRLIGELARLAPPNVSLLSLNLDVEETPAAAGALARAGSVAEKAAPEMERRMRVRVVGVAPTDIEVATFITELNRIPFFDRIAMSYARDRLDRQRLMREFELTFVIQLNAPPNW